MFNLLTTKFNANTENKPQFPHDYKHYLFENLKKPCLIKCSLIEIPVLLGILYFCDLYGLNHHDPDVSFSDKEGPPIFSASFSREQVRFLRASFSFINKTECKESFSKLNTFSAARPVF